MLYDTFIIYATKIQLQKAKKTTGSRVMFYRESDQRIILLHKPHPENTMDTGAIKDLIKYLKEYGEL